MRRVLAAVLIAGVAAGCSSGPGRSASSRTPAPSPSHASIPGTVTGRIPLHDSVWGDLVVITSVTHNVGFESSCGQPHVRIVDSAGRTRLSRDWSWGCGEIEPNRPATDKTGNVFLKYNPGRYYGVIVLRSAGGRIEDFGSLPAGGDAYEGKGPFGYYAETQDAHPRDGVLEIKQFSNNCNPSCAGGALTSEVFVWDGHRYVKRGTE